MRVTIDLRRGVKENASAYFEAAKKAKRKLGGLKKGEAELERKILAERQGSLPKETPLKIRRERKWHEKFHWFFTSEGFLVISGRDARGNDDVVKRHMGAGDVYFHADIQGAAHTILKSDGRVPGPQSRAEAAIFAAVFSKAWQFKLAAVDVYSVRPEQVSKTAQSGESMGTGAFMIRGEREWFRKTPLEFAVGYAQKGGTFEVFSGPPEAVKKMAGFSLNVSVGGMDKGDAAKKALSLFRQNAGKSAQFSLDDIVALLPSGGIAISG